MIRPYTPQDCKAVKFIAYADEQRGSMRGVCAWRCDYYIDNEPRHCFVSTDEFDKPTGFAICSVNRKKFADLYPAYLKTVKEESRKSYRAEKRLLKKLSALPPNYSARMVISVLPSFRGKGEAKALIQTLIDHLKTTKAKGLYTVTDTPSAVAFCERMGFHKVMRIDKKRCVYGFDLK